MNTKTPRQCGECTLCCFTHGVNPTGEETFRKKERELCVHCELGAGCKIYVDRPHNCRVFNCAWLGGERGEDERPDKTGLVMHFYRHGLHKIASFTHRDEDGLWQPYAQQLAHEYAAKGLISVLRTEKKKQAYLSRHTYLAPETAESWKKVGCEITYL